MGAVGYEWASWEYYWSLFVAAGLFAWQQKLSSIDRDNCFKAFRNNNVVGAVLGRVMSYL